ncbi:MAG: oxidoreductase [Acidobacteria bacterium]|nr:oxidoreductase [Acidobacteriota bacterium]
MNPEPSTVTRAPSPSIIGRVRTLITGASSGIGEALARELTRRGHAVALLARRAELLEAIASELPGSVAIPCDVGDAASVAAAVQQAEQALGGPLDLAVANAGVGAPSHAAKFKIEDAERMVRVNIVGTMNLFAAVIPGMIARRSGRFAGVASLAGYRGLPTSSVYSSTKAAMHSFLESSRIELVPYGVGVTIVNPGFVDTPMVKEPKKLPFIVSAEKAASIIADGLERGKRVVEFPLPMSLLMHALRFVPDSWYEKVLAPRVKLRNAS